MKYFDIKKNNNIDTSVMEELIIIKKNKYLFIFLIISFALMSVVSATDTNDTTHVTSEVSQDNMADTQEITHEISEKNIIQDDNSYVVKDNDEDKRVIQNITKKDKREENIKTEVAGDNVTFVNVTSSNFKQYFTVMSNVAYMGKGITSTNNSLILNVKYVPSNVYMFSFDENSDKFQNLNLLVDGNGCSALTNVGFKVSTNFKTFTLQNFDSVITESYTKSDYLTLTGTNGTYVVRNVSIDVQKRDLTTYVFRVEKKSLIENCNLKACLSECVINWDAYPYAPDCIGLYVKSVSELRNNHIEILVTGNSGGDYYSSFAAFLGTSGITFVNNTLISTNCTDDSGYSYGLVVRSSNNIITDNKIYITSHTYTAGIHLEMATFKNNLIKNNYINVTSSWGNAPWGNIAVAYAINMLDFQYMGNVFSMGGSHPNNNTIIQNNITGSAAQIYGVEMYGGYNNNISENNITLFARTAMGIGIIGANTIANNNNIVVLGEHNLTEGTADYLKAKTAGLYTYLTNTGIEFKNNTVYSENAPGIIIESSQNTIIEDNYVISEGHDYSVSLSGSNITVINNILEARNNLGDNSVTGQVNNTVENNTYPYEPSITINLPEKIVTGTQTPILITLKDDQGQPLTNKKIRLQISEQNTPEELTTNANGNSIYYYTPTSDGTKTITITSPQENHIQETSYTTEFKVIQKIILTPETFDTYITDGKFNDNVLEGAIIDVSGKFDNERYAFTVNKPVNIISSTGDAFFSFFSTPKSEGSSELPEHSFIINKEAAGTNITGITFENTMIVTTETHDINFDNITVYCTSGYGWGRGSTSIRNSQNVTVKNSYFNTTDNNGVSTLVFAASQNGLVENCTIVGSGFIGNLVYATTYNVAVNDTYGNNNITIRNNKIIARNLSPGIATCYSICLIGDNLTVEDNYIENSNNYLIMTQYKDDAYEVGGNTGSLTIRNNEFSQGKIGITFDPCTITNNTFYGEVTLDTTNNTIKENNIVKEAGENPYTTLETAQEHDAILNVEAPTNYYYNTQANINISLTEDDNVTPINDGRIEVYVEGVPYTNITVNNNKINFVFENETLGTHRIRFWYYTPNSNISNSQKLVTIESIPIGGTLQLQTPDEIHIGDTITLNVTYTLDQEVPLDVNITFNLPGQSSITIPAKNKQASLQTTITTDYIKNILGGREQNIKITATTNDTNVEITGINTKLGVKKANTQITITPTTTIINTPTTITATINTPTNLTINTGTITFTDKEGNTIATSNVKNNKATTTITFNNTGVNPITATYSETTHYEANTTTTNIQVQKQDTKITLNPIPTTTYNTNVTLTGTLTDKNGNTLKNMQITIQINNDTNTTTTNNNGAFTYTFTAPTSGQNNITATYNGNSNYKASNTTTTFNVNKQDLKITFDKIKDVVYGHEVTITGTFTDGQQNPRANIALRIFINGKGVSTRTDTNGKFSVTSKVGVIGTNNVTASHAGGANYNPTNTSTTFKMVKQDLLITVDKIANVVYGSSVKITGTLKDGDNNIRANTGVKILINGKSATAKTDKNGKYTFTTKIGKLGVNNVTVSHAGGTNYNPASASTTYTVVKQDLKITLNPIGTVTYGSVTITGKFTDSNNNPRANTGLKITINGKTATAKTDANGKFTLTTKVGVIGVNNVTAYHNGGSNYNPTKTNITFKMVKQNLKVTLDPIKDVTYGNSVVITGTFTDANGKIRANSALKIIINGKTLTTRTDAQGKFKATSKVGTIGTNNVTVSHNGGTGFNPTSTSTTFKMLKQNLKITINPINTVKKGSTLTVTGTFTDANGKIRANTNLKVKFNGVEHTTKTDTKGVFTFKTTANKVGTNTIIIAHTGGANYNPTNTTKTFTVTN